MIASAPRRARGVGYGQVVLTDVHAINAHAAGTQREGDINTVVDEEGLVRLDDAGDSFGELVELARADGFGPDLDAGGVFGCPDGFEGVVACDEVEVSGRGGVRGWCRGAFRGSCGSTIPRRVDVF